MHYRTLKILTSLFMAIVIVVVLVAARSTLWPSEETDVTTTPEQTTQGLATEPPDPTESAAPTTVADPVPLPVAIGQATTEPGQSLRRWPEDLSIPLLREPDLSLYAGRKKTEKPLEGITVILDPGHGGQDGGAQYPVKVLYPDVAEKDIVLSLSLKVRDQLEQLGADVVMLRETDVWQSVYYRIALVNRWIYQDFMEQLPYHGYESSSVDHLLPQLETMLEINSDYASSGGRGPMNGVGTHEDVKVLLDMQAQYTDVLFLSIHCNALDDDRVGGLQVYYLTNDHVHQTENNWVSGADPMANPPSYTRYDDEARLRLAELVRDQIIDRLPELKFPGENDLLPGNYVVLREIALTGLLIETGFITNEQDRAILTSVDGQTKISEGIAEAVFAYYCRP